VCSRNSAMVAAVRNRAGVTRRQIEPLVRQEATGRMGSATLAQTEAVLRVLEPAQQTVVDYRRYVDRLVNLARADLREAELGLGVSPVKEGLEVLRDHREGLRAAIDPPGLTKDSHWYFMTEYVPVVNRAVIGPQKERIQELLVLIDAGIVSLGPGPMPKLTPTGAGWILTSTRLARPHQIAVDMVVRANLTNPAGCAEFDPIAGSLRTWVAPGNSGSLRLDRDGFAVPRGEAVDGVGSRVRSVAIFGPPAEGASYYNHYVPSPGVWSRALTDLDRVIGPALSAAR